MDLLSLALGVLGIILTILLSDPILRVTRISMARIRRREWSADLYRRGKLQKVRHFGFEEWVVDASVDHEGSISYRFEARFVNLSGQLLETFYFPFFSDFKGITREQIGPWATSGRRSLPVGFAEFDGKRSQGRIAITHIPPLKPGERRRVAWGLELPRLFSAGDQFCDWDIEVPYYDMRGQFTFAPNWRAIYARWSNIQGSTHFEPPIFDANTIKWRVVLPEPGTRLHMELGLATYNQPTSFSASKLRPCGRIGLE